MKGIDTNVLVRFLVEDNVAQVRQARTSLKKRCTPESPGYVNLVVLAELVWVLESAYGYSRSQIVETVEGLLRTSELMVESTSRVWSAIRSYRAGCDFAGALIGVMNAEAGCDGTVTLDAKAAKRAPHFELLKT